MSRHNRRRTRGGHKASSSASSLHSSSSSTSSSSSIDMAMSSGPGEPPTLIAGTHSYGMQYPDTSFPSYTYTPTINRTNTVSARHWHNRYMAWQARERRAKEEKERESQYHSGLAGGIPRATPASTMAEAKKEKDKRRIFGDVSDDESGTEEEDDDEICKKMWEYFGGLDFIFDG